jgi:predicted glutamine amidotransferase
MVRNCYLNNPDGSGLIWVENNVLKTFKTMEDDKVLFEKYNQIKTDFPLTNIVLHFRISTSGTIDLNNCHPFNVNNKLAFVHNGIIHGLGGLKQSDTNQFNNDYLKKLPSNFLEWKGIVKLIKDTIGSSKLIFLDNQNNPFIINKGLGHSDNFGNWYSNDSYKYAYEEEDEKERNYWKEPDLCDFCSLPSKTYFDYETSCYLCKECSKTLNVKNYDKKNEYYF